MERRLGEGAAMKRPEREKRGSLRLAGEKADGLESAKPRLESFEASCTPFRNNSGDISCTTGRLSTEKAAGSAYPRWRYAGKRGGHTGL